MKPENTAVYLKNSARCPFCRSDEITTASPLEADNGRAVQSIHCTSCKRNWRDVYTLTGIEEIND